MRKSMKPSLQSDSNRGSSRRAQALVAGVRPVVEFLEGRQLMAVDLGASVTTATAWPSLSATRAVTNPSVAEVRPGNNATGVSREIFIAADLNLPNGGLNKTTIAGNVTLVRVRDGRVIAGSAGTSGGGDAITFTPAVTLDANTQYRFSVTAGVRDVSGAPMTAFSSVFTTGTTGGTANVGINFTKVQQAATAGSQYTAVTVGPDGKLYAATFDGLIKRWNVGADGTLSNGQTISVVNTQNGSARTITGFVFAPNSTASNLIAFVTHTQKSDLAGQNFTGKISRLSGPDLGTYQDYVTNLPRSVRDHLTNQAVFGPDGALYIAQGANTAMGAPDTSWGNRAESLLSAAILRLNIGAIATRITNGLGALNARTIDVGGTYNPYATNAPLTLYATGVRNAYDLVWASNGFLYAPVNGSAAGGNAPASSNTGLRPPTGTAYAGPTIPALENVRETQHDRLLRVRQGIYYGHPNPSRGQFVLGGGNPTAGVDPQEVLAYPVGTQPDSNWRGEIFDFGQSQSPNGIIQYKSNTFGGALKDKLLVVRYAGGDDIIALTLNSSGMIDTTKTMTGIGGGVGSFSDPVDLIEYTNPANAADPRNGMIFVAEYGGQRITLLRPGSNTNPSPDPGGPGNGGPATVTSTSGARIQLSRGALVFNAVRGQTSPTARLTITNTSTTALSITGLTLGGAQAGLFRITSNGGLPGTIAAGASATVTVVFNPSTTTTLGIQTATLTVASNDSARPSITVALRGLAHNGGGGQNEPSLQRILDLYQLGVQTGDRNAGNTNLYSPTETLAANEEVLVQTLVKATTGPVTIQPLATFAGGSPAVRFGYYAAGSTSSRNELFTIGSGEAQSVFQTPVGTTSFDPGTASFGIYATFPIFGNTAYSEDRLNTSEATVSNRRKVRFYPLKDAAGAVIPNAYVFASEDFANDRTGGYDVNDFVGIIRNVKVATAGTGLTIENLDGVPFDDRIVLSRIGIQPPEPQLDGNTGQFYNPPPNVVHDQATLRLTNSSSSPITINALTLSNASAWRIVSGPTPGSVLQPGASTQIVVKFIATKAPATTVNETIDPSGRARTFNGTYVNSLTISTTDPVNPNRTIQLAGYFQYKNERDQEPNISTLVNRMYGYTTKVLNAGQSLNTGGRVQAVGEEVITDYWRKADPNAPVSVRQLAAYHTQGDTGTLSWYSKTTKQLRTLMVHSGVEAQSLLPNTTSGTPGAANFNPDGDFGFKIDMEWSISSFNKQEQPGGGYGHHVRFWPARDRSGQLIPNTYIMGMDYLAKNYDYQDNVYLVSNIRAANGAGPSPDPVDPGVPSLGGLTLINAATDADIAPLVNGTAIDLSGGKQYTVRANAGTGTIGSVVFAVDGVITRTENSAPFSIAGENGTDYLPWSVPTGTRTLTVTPYSGANGTGNAGTPLVVTYTAGSGTTPTPTLGVTGLMLIDAATDTDLGLLTNGSVIDVSGGKQYSIRAVTAGTTRSVVFTLNGATIRTESAAPFTIAGDSGMPPATDYLPWTPPANGTYTLAATGYSERAAAGTVGSSVSLSITIANNGGGGSTPVGAGNFTGININSPPVGGSVTAGGAGIWTVRGSGSGTGGTKDQHFFAQQTRNGDFDVKARLASLSSGVTGLTLRSGTSAGNSVVSLIFAGGNIMFCTRNGFGNALQVSLAGTGNAGNVWLRMRRVGNTVTTFFGTDGVNWTTAGTANVAGIIPSSALFGFMASNGPTLNTARWEGVTG
jgi:glucose/arabinose dehydrogenase